MVSHIRLRKIHLASGAQLEVSEGVTAIVGPNNTGKSSLLRQLSGQATTPPQNWHMVERFVVDRPEFDFLGSAEEFMYEVEAKYPRREAGIYSYGQISQDHFRLPNGANLTLDEIRYVWGSATGLGGVGSYLMIYLNAEGRLGLTGDAASFDAYREQPSGPLQIMFANRDLERELSDLTATAFGVGVTVNRYSGGMIHLHAGAVRAAESASPQSQEYLEQLNKLPLLWAQGDGMRAFAGMIMAVITGQCPIVLIDEPEAFLHPPQARQFGRFLAQHARSGDGVQVLIATHSEDILAGLTSAGAPSGSVSIARLTRSGNVNHIAQLNQAAVQEIYADPLMKHYDMLNGLFSAGSVICEGDSDCTYYRAVLDDPSLEGVDYARDAHFTHTGGKARVEKAVRALRSTAVPVAAVFDADIFQSDREFYAVLGAVGADRAVAEPLRNSVVAAVEARAQPVRRAAVKAEIDDLLARSNAATVSASESRAIREVVARKTGWRDLKTAGRTMLSGGALDAFDALCAYLERYGIFVVQEGELERYHPSIAQGDKAEWLRRVLDGQLFRDSPAVPMLQRIATYLASAQSGASAEEAAATGG